MAKRPILALTIGDPAGIGTEISVKSLTKEDIYHLAKPFLIGSAQVIQDTIHRLGLLLDIHQVQQVQDCRYQFGTIDVLDIDNIDLSKLEMGKVQAACGKAAYEYIHKATDLAKTGEIDAIVTAPINKEALKAASIPYIGHTEMIAELLDAKSNMTMFMIEGMRIFFLTRHVSLAEACRLIRDPEIVYRGIQQCYDVLTDTLPHRPKLAVAGLNPHAGEGGLLGDEELVSLIPAVKRAVEAGMDVVGPVPADSVFHFAKKGAYDAVLSLYHDQGHIASKMIDFEKTVSVTVGLPTLRTSVDHGTAFDIAGKGIASSVSMEEAIKAAVSLLALA